MSCDTWVGSRGAELLFQVLTEREDQRGGHREQRELQRRTKTFADPPPLRRQRRPTDLAGNIVETGTVSIGWLTPARSERRPANVGG